MTTTTTATATTTTIEKERSVSEIQSHLATQPILQLGKAMADASRLDGSNSQAVMPTHCAQDSVSHFSFRPVERVNVRVRELSISVKLDSTSLWSLPGEGKKKRSEPCIQPKILEDISADMASGQLMAIIGGSGSGKTSMLNVMARRMTGSNISISGHTTYKDQTSLKDIRHAYVMQQDILIPTLTVRETLLYSAELRLPSLTTQERLKVVEEVILQLGLKECAGTRIGDNEHKGCSGGEKRRTSIGVQLLANPSVLFLDEPTTGLDATSAFQLVRTLKTLAEKGRTIITTIHQPRSEIWSLFDRVTLLSRGRCLYSGPASNAIEYFASLGYPLPPHVNIADYLIDLSAIDTRTPEAERETSARVSSLVTAWKETSERLGLVATQSNDPPGDSFGNETFIEGSTVKSPLWRQVYILTRRTFLASHRDPMGIFGCFLEATAMGLICGWVFYDLDGSLSGIRSRQASLYIASALQGYLILLYETYRLTSVDIKVFDRERGEGVVGALGWLLSRRLARLLTEDVPVPLLFSIIYYFMVGFEPNGVQFLTFFSVILLGQFIAVSLATLCAAISRNFAEASLVANLSFTIQSMASGFFIQTNSMPVYIRWTRWISYVFYSFGALVTNEFRESFYDCPSGGPEDPQCIEYRGDFILRSLGFDEYWMTLPIIACVIFVVLFYIAAGLLLQFFVVDINISQAKRKNDGDASAGKERMRNGSSSDTQIIDVVLSNIRLDIMKKGILPRFSEHIQILKGVSAKFEAGKLNVIMGPSGSGKSTLLNFMSKRLYSTLLTRYRSSGDILLNGAVPTESVMRSLCSYVTQDDDALLPFLTVRETLHFAAGLRLPKWIPAAEKKRRAEEVILKMGLKDCADNLIGSEFAKGISGGEKRRVTIAVQILTEPKILLLDEPTSGLDAFTAGSILSVLKALADEGRTIISTIHQSRSDLFEQFGNVLLLARGGSVIYSGNASQMLPYFSSAGHECPRYTNPADFALDLVTVDLQHDEKERISRAKVQSLIDKFDHRNAIPREGQHRVVSLPAELGRMQRGRAPFGVAYPILLRRGLLNFQRQPMLIVARLAQVVGLAVVLSLFFAPLGNDYYAVQARLGFVQQITPLYFVGMLQNVAAFPPERDVFYREYSDSAYATSTFFISYLTSEIPFEVVTSLVFSVFTTYAVGLYGPAIGQWKMFLIAAFNAFCITSCGESVGIVFNTLVRHTGFAVNLTSTILSVGTFMAGIMSINMPWFLEAVNHVSPLKYVVGNIAPWSLRGFKFVCPTPEQQVPGSVGQCIISTGEQALALYGLDKTDPKINLVALAVCAVVYRIVAYGVLRVKMMDFGVKSVGKKGPAEEKGKEGIKDREKAVGDGSGSGGVMSGLGNELDEKGSGSARTRLEVEKEELEIEVGGPRRRS